MDAFRSGFRTVLRQPALILAEIAWRWSFGAAAWVLVVLSVRGVLAGIDVSEAEYLLARHSDVFLIADAGARILYQTLPAFVRLAAVLVPALTAIWIVAATLGRAATLKALLEQKEREVGPGAPAGAGLNISGSSAAAGARARGNFASLLFLNLLRALFTLATLLAFLGAMILAGAAFPAQGPYPTTAAMIWVLLAALAAFFWSIINWFLALAPIWIIRDARGALAGIADSVALFRRNPASYVVAAWWFGFMRTIALLAAFTAALLAAAAIQSFRAGFAMASLMALAYFAVADFLYIARIAAYVNLAGESPQKSAIPLQPLAPEPQPLTTSEC